ncbi:hypothetical protein [Cytobacillus firmus]|uniref:hypothetical protein n=1 Tax=Cytobacillus firmus TaxID=1399 RepID=UPI0024C19BD6|nr:hypothetical protein [Cytobacillus firmus]WHY59903.1 hypothetical protein QNH42_15070 [Cytobacillus firmus]
MTRKRTLSDETKISGTDKTLIDFWNWGFSDLLSNSLRGIFAEFLVGSALDCLNQSRIEWDAYDLIYRGIKIEVKSAAYVQSWHTDTFSKISFNIGAKREYSYTTRKYSTEIRRHADVYIFCLLKEKDIDTIGPLDINQWEFYIVLTKVLDQRYPSQKTISLSSLSKIAKPLKYVEIKQRIDEIT